MPPKRYEVQAKVISIKGTCNAGHNVGDEWVIGRTTPEGICLSAFNSIFPNLRILQFGGSPPGSDDPESTRSACPDPKNELVIELRRIRKD
ncbi:TIGR04076 family protein [Chloroflexota bacterium]